jgi:hypothetical protein
MILQYLKVLLSWPPVVLFLALLLLPKFGVPLSSLIKRIKRGKAAGFEIELEQEQLQSKTPAVAPQGDQLTQISHDPQLARAEILKWWLAAVSENVFHKIFGTQVKLLEYLQSKEPTGETEQNLAPFFVEHKRLVETAPLPMPGSTDWAAFVGFLKASNLVIEDVRNGEKFFRISDLGRGFLAYTKATWGSYASTRAL